MADVTVGTTLLNWKRPQHIRPVVEGLWRQSVRPVVWLWNNNPDHAGWEFPCDHRFDLPYNAVCWPRWLMMSLMPCEYVFSWDDDQAMIDEHVLRDTLAAARRIEARGCMRYVLGSQGVIFRESYKRSRRVTWPAKDRRVDLVLGRFVFCRRDLLDDLRLGDRPTCDDDLLVSALAEERWILGGFKGRIRNLREGGEGLSAGCRSFPRRDATARRLFPHCFS